MSVQQIEHELARLRMNDDGTLGLRASVLNLIVITDEDSAESVARSVSDLAGRYPSRAIVLIADRKSRRRTWTSASRPSATCGAGPVVPRSAPSR
jgi:hypothetical protein